MISKDLKIMTVLVWCLHPPHPMTTTVNFILIFPQLQTSYDCVILFITVRGFCSLVWMCLKNRNPGNKIPSGTNELFFDIPRKKVTKVRVATSDEDQKWPFVSTAHSSSPWWSVELVSYFASLWPSWLRSTALLVFNLSQRSVRFQLTPWALFRIEIGWWRRSKNHISLGLTLNRPFSMFLLFL